MRTSEIESESFSADDEAFFHAGEDFDEALPSERPITLEVEPIVEPKRSPEREARRARFLRPVASTLAFLSLVTLVGLVRYALRSQSAELETHPPHVVRSSTTAMPVSGAAPVRELSATMLGTDEEPPSLLMTTDDEAPSAESLARASLPEEVATPAGVVAPEVQSSSIRPSRGVKAKPLPQAPRHGALVSRPARKVAPVTKSALLNAIRAS